MSHINTNSVNQNDELNEVNLSLYANSIELWRVEQKCQLKLKSIECIENSTVQVDTENKGLENQLQDTKSRIKEIKEYLVSMDNIILSFYETLAHLDVEYQKKKILFNKSKNDHELQLFIRMEFWQKEEERFNNIPEVKSLKIADSELNNIKLEYEELLDYQKILIGKIKKAEEQNNEKRNYVIVEFAIVYMEMLILNKREENCITLLRKLDTEYNEKLNLKNELLESSKKKVNKISFWAHTLCPFDSKTIDIKLDSLSLEVNNLKYSNLCDISGMQKLDNEVLKSNHKLIKKVTFLLPSEDQIPSSNDDILNECKHINTNLVKNDIISNDDMNSNSSLIKDDNLVNMNLIQQYQNNMFMEPSNINFNDNEKLIKEHDFDLKTNKRKITEVNLDFEFKKPYNPVQQENQMDKNLTQITCQPSTEKNEDIYMEVNEPKNSCVGNNLYLQKTNSPKSVDQSEFKNISYENSSILELQSNETLSVPNNTFSGLFLNNEAFQNSINNSFCESELSELFENSFDSSQYPDLQFNFSNPLNLNSNATSESNLKESNMKIPQQSGNNVFQPHKYEPFKKMFANNTYVNETTSSAQSFSTEPIRPHFVTSEQFRFNLN